MNSGRSLLVKYGAVPTVIAGCRSKSLTINRNPVDITNDDDDGWRGLLAEPGEKQLDLSVSGVAKNDVFKEKAMNSEAFEDLSIEFPDGSKIEGDFFIASYAETGEYNGAITFECSFQSSGIISYTGASA